MTEQAGPSDIPPPATSDSGCGLCENDLDVVFKALFPVAAKYKYLGLQLKVKSSDIKLIEMQYTSPKERLYEILNLSLKQLPPLTWYDIYQALCSTTVNERQVAQDIEKEYGHDLSFQTHSTRNELVSRTNDKQEKQSQKRRHLKQKRGIHGHNQKHGSCKDSFTSCSDDEELSSADPSLRRTRKKVKTRKRQHDEESSNSSMETNSPPTSSPSSSDSDHDEQYHQKMKWKTKHSRPSGSKYKGRSHKYLERRGSTESASSASSSESYKRKKTKHVRSHKQEKSRRKSGKKLRNVFRDQFGKLCLAIIDPLDVAPLLREKGLLSRSMMDKVLTGPFSKQEKVVNLVHAVERNIKSNPDHLYVFIEVLLRDVTLQEVGNAMWKEAGKVCPERTEAKCGSTQPPTKQQPSPQSRQEHTTRECTHPEGMTHTLEPVQAMECTTQLPVHPPTSHSQTSENKPTQQVPLSPVLQDYKCYLQAVYNARDIAQADKYLPTLKAKYTNLAMVRREFDTQEERDEFTRATLHGGVDQILEHKSPINITDLMTPTKGSKPVRFILVKGPPGIGKSTFAWEICRKWDELPMLRDYHAVVLVRLRERWALNATSLPELFRYPADPELSKSVAKELNKTQGVNLVLILDGYDEVSHNFHEGSVLKHILSRKLLPECTIILTTRPSANSTLQIDFQPQTDKHIEIIGFTEKERVHYITEVFHDKPQHQANFLECMFQVPHIKSMMYIPLNCAIIAQVYIESQDNPNLAIPQTRTQLYRALTHSLLMRHMAGKNKNVGSSLMLPEYLPEEELAKFSKLARFAFESYHSVKVRKITFFKEDIPGGLEHFGFMNESTQMYAGKGMEQTHAFLHLSLQEYLAAWHLAKSCSNECQIAYHELTLDEKTERESADQDDSEETRAFVSKLNPLASSLVEPAIFLAGITGWKGPPGNNPWETYLSSTSINVFTSSILLQSLYESQNPEICEHYFATKSFPLWEVMVGSTDIIFTADKVTLNYSSSRTAYNCYAISYCLNFCQENVRLKISLSKEDISRVEMFCRGLGDHCCNKTLNIKDLHLMLFQGGNKVSFAWLTSVRELFLTELEEFTFDSYSADITCIDDLQNLLEPLPSLKSVKFQVKDCSSLKWLEELKSLKKVNILNISSKHSFSEPDSICWLLQNCLTELKLDIPLPPAVCDIGLQSTNPYMSSVLKSILVSKQITKLLLPYVSRETMKSVRRMLLECGNLVELEMMIARLGYDGMLYICSALRNNATLTHLTIHEHFEYDVIDSEGEILHVESIPSPNVATCTTFLLEMNDILRTNTTLKELNIIWLEMIFSGGRPCMWRIFPGPGPPQQLESIKSTTPHTLRKSYSMSDVSQPQTDILWLGSLERNVASELEHVMADLPSEETATTIPWEAVFEHVMADLPSEETATTIPWEAVFEQLFSKKRKRGKKCCSIPSFTAPDTDILQSFVHLDPRLKDCLGISDGHVQLNKIAEDFEDPTLWQHRFFCIPDWIRRPTKIILFNDGHYYVTVT